MRYHRTRPYINRDCCPSFLGEYFPLSLESPAIGTRFRTESLTDAEPTKDFKKEFSNTAIRVEDSLASLKETLDLLEDSFYYYYEYRNEDILRERVPLLFDLCAERIRSHMEDIKDTVIQARTYLGHEL